MDIVNLEFPVLDDGHIRVLDSMGSDQAIIDAARGTTKTARRVHDDEALLRYLMRHHHTTPFEMCEIKLHIRCPMDVWRQWIRHRTASVNEYSTRYQEAIDSRYVVDEAWRTQSASNRQGSDGYITDAAVLMELSDDETNLHAHAQDVYKRRLALGVAKEQARKDLPLSTYTEAVWKINLHNLLHFLQLRMDSHAQWEIQQYAKIIGWKVVAQWCPITWAAFLDYRLNAITFSQSEWQAISTITVDYDHIKHTATNRELQELRTKIERIQTTYAI